MKTKTLGLVTLFLMTVLVVFAGTKTEKIENKGNYGMCESRIEKAAKTVDRVGKPTGIKRPSNWK
jgi:mercuric ion binding protein